MNGTELHRVARCERIEFRGEYPHERSVLHLRKVYCRTNVESALLRLASETWLRNQHRKRAGGENQSGHTMIRAVDKDYGRLAPCVGYETRYAKLRLDNVRAEGARVCETDSHDCRE